MNVYNIKEMIKDEGVVFLTYGGFLSQPIIAGMTEALEKEAESVELNMGIASNIFTIFVELSQNMMNYSKSDEHGDRDIDPTGLVVVTKTDDYYYIHSQNVVSVEDKSKMDPKLIDITTMNKDEIKARYKELRRSGKDTHGKGGGIGFYEIAKRCDSVKYDFKSINDDKFEFHFEATIKSNKD